MAFLRRHWLILAVLAVACFLGVQWCAAEGRANRLDDDIREARDDVAAAEAVVVERDLAVADADARAAADSARADSLARELRKVSARTPGLITRARDVARDTAGPRTAVVAYIDSLSAQLEAVTVKMEQTIQAKDAEIASLRFAIVARDATIIARDRNIVALEGYVETLEAKLNAGGTILWDLAAVVAGCGGGYALSGLRGCGIGAASGAVLTLGYRGVRSFLDDLR